MVAVTLAESINTTAGANITVLAGQVQQDVS